jgi:hypothetical protein
MMHFRLFVALVLLVAPAAYADVIYDYTGAPFDSVAGTSPYLASPPFTIGESIDLTVDFSTALPPGLVDQSVTPTSWSMDFGATDYISGESGVTLESTLFSTDPAGNNIDNWFVTVSLDPAFQISTTGANPRLSVQASDRATVPGTEYAGEAFTDTMPATPGLLILGLAALLFLARRRSHA